MCAKNQLIPQNKTYIYIYKKLLKKNKKRKKNQKKKKEKMKQETNTPAKAGDPP